MRAGSRCGLSLLAVVAAILALPMAAAGEHPNRGRGLDPEGSYQQVGVLDSVNLFNGTPVIRIPIGPTYPVAGSLNYSLALYYSGNVWDQEWRQDGQNLYSQSLPNRRSNAGLGWLLSLGRMILPSDPTNHTGAYWLYESPDGSEHVLYPTLHNGESMISGIFYSRNGTYLRFKSTPMTLEFPDGKIHVFNTQGQLTQITDRFGNYLNVTYPDANTWQLTDQHGRSHFAYFDNLVYDSWTQKTLYRVVVRAFNGTTATYNFGVSYPTMSRYCDTDPQTPHSVSVPLLTNIALPDGSSYAIATTDYDRGDGVSCSNSSGQLRGMTLPTLGRIEWDYTTWLYPSIAGTCDDFFARSNGISKRRLRRADGVLDGEWTYTPSLDSPDGCANPNARELKVTVSDPLAHKQEHFFSVSLIDTGAWKKGEYGMPFTHHVADGTGTRFLSSRTYSGASTLLRRGFSRWEYEAPWETSPTFSLYDGNRRLVSGRTVFEDDGAKYADLDLSNFDGLGHYRQNTTNGNFDSGNVRTGFTNFNPSNGTYGVNFVMIGSTAPWVLETFTYRDEIEAGVTARAEFCFNSTTGALDRVRTLKTGTSRVASDLLSVYTVDSAGQLTQERYFGGDTQSINNGGSCTFGLPADQYRLDHTYQYGVRKTSEYRDASGVPLSFKSLDVDVDLNTGLVRASRDTSGIQTDFEYDSLGRLRFSKPAAGHDGWTETAYTRATSPSSLARANVYRRTNGASSGASLAQNETRYDAFGRISEERVLMPDGSWSSRATTYNGREWTATASELGSPGNVTQYLNYDPFGRPGIIRPPDGFAHDVTFSYLGDRQKARTAKVATTQHFDGTIIESSATTTERYDRQGRLWQVVQPINLTATHGYDVGNRLKTVALTSGPTTQNRVFTYDNRGFLNSEQHPEKGGPSGNGVVTYSGYDARGHATQKTDGPSNLTFTYDRAERVTQVRETAGLQRTLKTFTYGTSSAFGVWNNGKRTIAERFNYSSLPSASTVKIQEVYFYAQRQGRVSYKAAQATVNGTPREAFAQTSSFNDLGQVNQVGYPDCTHSPCDSQVPSPGSVDFAYTNGFLTAALPGRITSITYHPNGLAHQITHGNGVLETHGYDPQGMARARSFLAQHLSNLRWSSGNYQYDGAGNVTKIGNSVYLYDLGGRLTSGKVYADPLGGGSPSLQTYSYDPFGNIQSIDGVTGRATPTSSLTNRMIGAASYDTAGNLTSWNNNGYTYDQFNLMNRMVSGSEDWYFFYTADDERIWLQEDLGFGYFRSEWTLRGLDSEVLSIFSESTGLWNLFRQVVHRGGALAATKASGQWRAMHPDHLGTPRAITDLSGSNTAYHAYYAFGEEVTGFAQDDETMKFTGHERDLASTAGSGDDLDYMHARHFSPLTGRFMSTDRAAGVSTEPQLWNRYSYVVNSPLVLVDPSGNLPELPDPNFCGDLPDEELSPRPRLPRDPFEGCRNGCTDPCRDYSKSCNERKCKSNASCEDCCEKWYRKTISAPSCNLQCRTVNDIGRRACKEACYGI